MTRYLIRRLLWIIPVLFVVSVITFTADARGARAGPWAREKALPANGRRASTRSTAWTTRSRSSTSTGSATCSRATSGPSYKFVDRTRQRHRRRRDLDHRPARADGLRAVRARRHPARDLRRPRPQPLAGLPLDRHLDHRHRHAQFRAGDPADRLLRGDPHVLPTEGWKGPETWVLPTIALAGFPIAVIARYTRASMLEVTRKDYIRTAHSKGVARRQGRVPAHDPQCAHPGRDDPRARRSRSWSPARSSSRRSSRSRASAATTSRRSASTTTGC